MSGFNAKKLGSYGQSKYVIGMGRTRSTVASVTREYNYLAKTSATPLFSLFQFSAPSAPILLRATPSEGQVQIDLIEGYNGGAPITNYEYSTNNGSTWTPFNPATTSSRVTIRGLTNGESYTIKMRGVNPVGTGTASSALTAVLSAIVPAPTITDVSPITLTSLSVSFTQPPNPKGNPITNYYYSLNGGETFVPLPTPQMSSPITINGLTPHVNYDIVIKAYSNIDGLSNSSLTLLSAPYFGVDFEATASSVRGGNIALLAFDGKNNTTWISNYIQSGSYYPYDNNGTYIGLLTTPPVFYTTNVISVGDVSGEWIQIKFPFPFLLTRYSYDSNVNSYNRRIPREFYIVGSNDGTSWNVVQYRNDPSETANTTSPYTYDVTSNMSYTHYRMIISRVYKQTAQRTELTNFNLIGFVKSTQVKLFSLNTDSTLALYYPFDNTISGKELWNYNNYFSGGNPVNDLTITNSPNASIETTIKNIGTSSLNIGTQLGLYRKNIPITNSLNFTLLFWIYTPSTYLIGTSNRFLSIDLSGPGSNAVYTIYRVANGRYNCDSTMSAPNGDNSINLPPSRDNKWHQIGLIARNGVTEMWVDGNKTYEAPSVYNGMPNINQTNLQITIGPNAVSNPGRYIDDVRVYTRALTHYDILQVYRYSGNLSIPSNVRFVKIRPPIITSIYQTTLNSVALEIGETSSSNAPTNYYYSLNGGETFSPLSPVDLVSPLVITGLSPDVTYDIALKSYNPIDGLSDASNIVTTKIYSPNTDPALIYYFPYDGTFVNKEFWNYNNYFVDGSITNDIQEINGTQTTRPPEVVGDRGLFNDVGSNSITYNNKTLNPNHFTISLWTKVSDFVPLDQGNKRICTLSFGEENGYLILQNSEGSYRIDGDNNRYIGYVPTTEFVPAGVFHHWAIVADGTSIFYYLNGNLVSTQTISPLTDPTTTTEIIVGSVDSTYNVKHNTDDFRLYNRSLSHDEILQIYRYRGSLASPTDIKFVKFAPPIITAIYQTSLTSVNVEFSQPPASTAVTKYYYSINGGTTFTELIPTDITSPISIAGLTAGQTYSICLKAYNPVDGLSDASNIVTAKIFSPNADTSLIAYYPFDSSISGKETWDYSKYFITGNVNDISNNLTQLQTVKPPQISSEIKQIGTGSLNTSSGKLERNFSNINAKNISVFFWMYVSTNTVGSSFYIQIGDLFQTFNPLLVNGVTLLSSNGNIGSINGTLFTVDNNWHHVGIVIKNGYTTFWLDGTNLGTASSQTITTQTSVYISMGGYDDNTTVSRHSDDVRVYSRAFSDDEVLQVYRYRGNVVAPFNVSFPIVIMPPTITTLNQTSTSVVVSFRQPTGPDSINNYYYSIDGGQTFTALNPPNTTSPITISGLNAGQSYSIALKAYNQRYNLLSDSSNQMEKPLCTPIRNMNSSIITRNNITYVASASSNRGDSLPYMAFDGSLNTIWHANYSSTYNVYPYDENNTGKYIGQMQFYTTKIQGVGDVSGEWIQLEFSMPFLLKNYSYGARSTTLRNTPRKFYIVGSNDGGNWYQVDYRDNSGQTVSSSYNYTVSSVYYRCYRMVISEVFNGSGCELVNWDLNGLYKNIVTTQIPTPVITSIKPVPNSSTSATVEFQQVQGIGTPITNYYYSLDGGVNFVALSPANSSSPIVITGLTPEQTYSIAIKAYTSSGQLLSSASNVVSGVALSNTPIVGINSNTYIKNGFTYEISASSSRSGHPQYQAFDGNINTYWNTNYQTGPPRIMPYPDGSYVGGINYYTTNILSVGDVSGEWIQIKFPRPFLLTSHSYYSPYASLPDNRRAPRVYYIVGSINGIDWHVVQYVNNINTSTPPTGGFNYNVSSTNYYTYYRMVVTNLYYTGPEYLVLNSWDLTGIIAQPTTTQFTTVGTTTWTAPTGVTSVEYLVVGGGGGGGGSYDTGAGGGGGGGLVLYGTKEVVPGTSYTIEVGDGGAGGIGVGNGVGDGTSYAGNASKFDTIIASGGGAGNGSLIDRTGTGGAQGNADTLTAPTGGKGGRPTAGASGGGGGGGMGSAGSSGTMSNPPGGSGVTYSISGSSQSYGAGGSGGRTNYNANGANAAPNTGNGGQGASSVSVDGSTGGKGGSGIVILKYY